MQRRIRTVTPVDFATGLNNVTLEGKKYYMPTAPNNPLSDSFTIDVHYHHLLLLSLSSRLQPRRSVEDPIRATSTSAKSWLVYTSFASPVLKLHTPQPFLRANHNISGRCLLAGARTTESMTIVGMPSVYLFQYVFTPKFAMEAESWANPRFPNGTHPSACIVLRL